MTKNKKTMEAAVTMEKHKHWTEKNGKHVLRLTVDGTPCDVAELFCSTDGVWTYELTLFRFARDVQGGLSIAAMQQSIEEELENHLAGEIAFYERLRGALKRKCGNCRYGYLDALEDRICVCDKADNRTEWVDDEDYCTCWEARDDGD